MADELSEDQERQLRATLESLQVKLKAQLDGLKDGVRPVDLETPIGRLSRMDAMQQQKMAEASRRAIRQRQDRVGAALASMGRDEYGFCLRCEQPIGYKRLQARPESALCLGCQGASEGRR